MYNTFSSFLNKSNLMKKLYYSISEVSKRTGVKPYVLRYWESEFNEFLHPKKEHKRLYKEKDIELIIQIKDLLYNKKYTLAGAKQKLKEEKTRSNNNKLKEIIGRVKEELKSLLEMLEM